MVEKNPYETNGPVEVPNFMKSDKKEDVDMSVFKLKEEDVDTEEYDDEEEVERKPIKKEALISIIAVAVSLALLIALIVVVVVKNNTYKSLNSTYETYKQTTDNQLSKLKTENETLTKQVSTLKEENEKLKAEIAAQSTPGGAQEGGTTGEQSDGKLVAGNYKMAGVNVRVEPSTDAKKIDRATVPQSIKEITNDNSTLVDGTTVKIIEVKAVGQSYWGKLADNCWVCLRQNGSNFYY